MVYFTAKGYDNQAKKISALEEKLRNLQSQVKDSCEVGGNIWHDNASYEHLSEEIRLLDNQLKREHALLNQALVISYPTSVKNVCLGSEVDLVIDENNRTFQIVAYGESAPKEGKILYTTPLAKAIIGYEIGEIVEANIGGSKKEIEIIDVRPITSE